MTAVLVTIPFSHFCEKARWGLERAKVPFREDPWAPGLHMIRTRQRGRRRSSVPLLITDEGTRFHDSTAILELADGGRGVLYPKDPTQAAAVRALEGRFDRELGPNTRRAVYFHALSERRRALQLLRSGSPRWQGLVLGVVFPALRALMRKGMKIQADTAAASVEKVRALFHDVSALLEAHGGTFLVGSTFTAADLTFASLAAPVLLPAEYGAALPPMDALPEPLSILVRELRATPAGAFALRLYRDHRR